MDESGGGFVYWRASHTMAEVAAALMQRGFAPIPGCPFGCMVVDETLPSETYLAQLHAHGMLLFRGLTGAWDLLLCLRVEATSPPRSPLHVHLLSRERMSRRPLTKIS